jgi:hypothetical protein
MGLGSEFDRETPGQVGPPGLMSPKTVADEGFPGFSRVNSSRIGVAVAGWGYLYPYTKAVIPGIVKAKYGKSREYCVWELHSA